MPPSQLQNDEGSICRSPCEIVQRAQPRGEGHLTRQEKRQEFSPKGLKVPQRGKTLQAAGSLTGEKQMEYGND